MPEQPENPDRFKPAMPRIPGVDERRPESHEAAREPRSGWHTTAALTIVLVVAAATAWWAFRSRRVPGGAGGPAASPATAPAPNAAASGVNPSAASPPTTPEAPGEIATVDELTKPWSAKRFIFRKGVAQEPVPAIVVRLPNGAARRSATFWAFSLQEPYGRCELEYVTDSEQLARQYGFLSRHPMIASPCSGTLYDPLRLATIAGGAWVRGEVVRGHAFRPPFAIEIVVRGDRLVATQME